MVISVDGGDIIANGGTVTVVTLEGADVEALPVL
jgi:hypothetical protein